MLTDPALTSSAEAAPRRQFGRRVVVAVALVAQIATGIVVISLRHGHKSYRALTVGHVGILGVSAPYTIRLEKDGDSDTSYVLTGKPGTTGSVIYALRVRGGPPVTLLGLDAHHSAGLSGLGWKPFRAVGPASHAQSLPVTFPTGRDIKIVVDVRKPDCTSQRNAIVANVPIRWSSDGVTDTYNLGITGSTESSLPIALCPTAGQIARSTIQAS